MLFTAVFICLGIICSVYVFSKRQYLDVALFVPVISGLIIGFAVPHFMKSSIMTDVEIWNGGVTSKNSEKVSCEHSYSCNCVTSCSGSGSNTSCSTICQTCYDHPYDIDWNVNTSVGQLKIDRVDRQGMTEPIRWTKVQVGEPASIPYEFTNYLKATDRTLHNRDVKITYPMPEYPQVFDYYRVNRIISADTPVSQFKEWNDDLNEMLKDVSARRRANVVVVVTKVTDVDFVHQLQSKWLSGKKNDIVITISKTDKVNWVKVFSWSTSDLFNVALADDLKKTEFGKAMTPIIKDHILKNFTKKSMSQYEYLENEIEMPGYAIFGSLILLIIVSFVCVRVRQFMLKFIFERS